MNSTIKDLEKTISDLQAVVKRLKLSEMEMKNDNEFLKFKEFILDNFEQTNNYNDYILCKDLLKWCIVHLPIDLSTRTIELYLARLFTSGSKRIGKKIYKVKWGIKPIKLGLEFDCHNHSQN